MRDLYTVVLRGGGGISRPIEILLVFTNEASPVPAISKLTRNIISYKQNVLPIYYASQEPEEINKIN